MLYSSTNLLIIIPASSVAIPAVIIAVAKNIGMFSCSVAMLLITSIAPFLALLMVTKVIIEIIMSAVPMLPSNTRYFLPVIFNIVVGSHDACAAPIPGSNVVSIKALIPPVTAWIECFVLTDIIVVKSCSGIFVWFIKLNTSVLVPNSPENNRNNGWSIVDVSVINPSIPDKTTIMTAHIFSLTVCSLRIKITTIAINKVAV